MNTRAIDRRGFGMMALGALGAPGIARAQSPGKIVAMSFGGGVNLMWRQAFATPFTARTGIPVDVVDASDPAAQVRAHASKPPYNVVTATYCDAVNLHKEGLLETFDPSELPESARTPKAYTLTGSDGKLLGSPVYRTYYGIAYNTDLVKPGEIKSWKDLADPKWKGRIAIARPVFGSIYDLTIYSYATGGDEKNIQGGLELYRKIAANALTAFNSLAQANQLLSRGEVYAAPYYGARVWDMKKSGMAVDMVIPPEGALTLPYLSMVPKGAANLAAAKAMLNFVMEPEPQARASDLAGYLPLSDGANVSSQLETLIGISYTELKKRLIEPDWTYIAGKQAERADIVAQLMAK